MGWEKKETKQKAPEPREIKSAQIEIKEGGATLSLDGKEFFLKRNDLLRLVNAFSPGTEPLRITDLIREDSYSDLNNMEQTARLFVFMNRKRLPASEAAKKMEIPYERFILWLNDNQSKIERKRLMAQKDVFFKTANEFDKAMFPEDHRPEPKMKEFDPKKVAKLFIECGNIDDVCKRLNVKREDFMPYFQTHMKEINKYINMAAEDRIINALNQELNP